MAYRNTDIGKEANVPYKQYICDSAADLEDIKKEFCSIALCLNEDEGTDLYICNSSLEWVKL